MHCRPDCSDGQLAYKSGTMTITLEGKGKAIEALRDATIRAGETVPSIQQGFARAEFSTVDMKVEAQVMPGDTKTLVIRGSSSSNVGRS